jgi:predicted methyltransferase
VGEDALRSVLAAAGVAARKLRTVVGLLTEGEHTLASLIRESALERRGVESVLAALGDDLLRSGRDALRIVPGRAETYRQIVNYGQLVETKPADPLARRFAGCAELVARMRALIDAAPGPRAALDHVSATAETAVRRALWLDSTFDLTGARLLCVGDHDLTSLAVAHVNPDVEILVLDIDDRILEFIDSLQLRQVRSLWSDFRYGIPANALQWGDLVFTDPPYTPEGVRLFLARGLTGLRDRDHARLVLAYGFAEGSPALGLKVQQEIIGLHLVTEAVLPDFHRYDGAQAVGSASDLYVLRPTARSWRVAEQSQSSHIYTHGSQSLEGVAALDPETTTAVTKAAAGPDPLPVTLVGPGFSAGAAPLGSLLAGEPARGRMARAVAVDLTADPGGWLSRVLLAVAAPRLALLVDNNHPDLVNAVAQQALADLVGTRYRLKLRRSTPGPRLAVVEADLVDVADVDASGRVVREVLDRAHGKLGNVWREAWIRAGARDGVTVTKNEARARVAAVAAFAGLPERWLDEQLIVLPRHGIARILAAILREPTSQTASGER